METDEIIVNTDAREDKLLIYTLASLVNPSLTLGMIIMCLGACGAMSLKARTCMISRKKEKEKMKQKRDEADTGKRDHTPKSRQAQIIKSVSHCQSTNFRSHCYKFVKTPC